MHSQEIISPPRDSRENTMNKLFLLLAALLLSSQTYADEPISLMTEEFAPYQFYQGDDESKAIAGISIEIVEAMQQLMGTDNAVRVLPWSRALKLLDKKPNSALFSTTRTPDREDKYKWVGPISTLDIVFFKKVGSAVEISSVEDAKNLSRIGVTKNVATHEILGNMGFSNLDVLQSGSDDKNIKRLVKGRIDVWPTAYYAGIYSAKLQGHLDDIEVIQDVSIMSGHLYIAFNKETDDEIIHQWQLALDQLKSEGIIEAILSKYDK